jgi:hypothetical protein
MSYKDVSNGILKILLKQKLSANYIAKALVLKFEESNSFATSKENIMLFEQIQYSDSELIERILNARQNNRQIYDSTGVAERVTKLIDKLRPFKASK